MHSVTSNNKHSQHNVTNNINNGMFKVQFNAYDWRFRSMNSI